MSNRALVLKELHDLLEREDKNNCYGVDYWNDENDPYHWEITLVAPKESLYEGGFFKLEVKIPTDYPKHPPNIKFLTRIYHCNIGKDDGYICINTLSNWKENYSMEDLLNHLVVLLHQQNADDPANYEMQNEYNNNKSHFEANARDWVQKYASINNYDDEKNFYSYLP